MRTSQAVTVSVWAAAWLGPGALTVVLVKVGGHDQRLYVFLYLALVGLLGVVRGFWAAITAAAISFLLVDYYFVPPVGTLTIADSQDIVNLIAFVVTAAGVGMLASRRRDALLKAEALASQLREANSELIRLNKEQAVASQAAIRLARSEQQVQALQESDRLRRDLLANVSHELRTPLGTILTESTGGAAPLSDQDATRRLQTIAAQARRLKALVDDMLDMTRIEGGALDLNLEAIRIGDAIASATERLHTVSPARAVEWDKAAAGIEVLADWTRLGQVFDNLLANADRFAPAGTPIEVRVNREAPGMVTIRIADRGPGVPVEIKERLFQRFVRGDPDPSGGQAPGTGLGLAIVRGLVEAHAGSIALEDGPAGTGAVFRFTLPEPGPGE